MKRVFFHYKEWEDHKHGMYKTRCENEDFTQLRVKRLLSDPKGLKQYMSRVVRDWKKSAEMQLSNRSRNRQAWLGQAASCLYAQAPEYVTKNAWRDLTDEQRAAANKVADEIILDWERSCQKS